MSPRTKVVPESYEPRTDVVPESHEVRTDVVPMSELNRTVGRFPTTQVAAALGVSEGAIRKWFYKACGVCPTEWLKVNGKHTELSAALLADYHARVASGVLAADAWVIEMRNQFEVAPKKVDVIPDTAIALRSNDATAGALDLYLAELGSEILEATQKVDRLMEDLEADEMALLQAEIEAARQKGVQKATILYAAEKQGQNEAAQVLRQREIERRRGGQA